MNDDINFFYEANTDVYLSCAATLNDEMWVFGGFNIRRQVNKYIIFNDNIRNKNLFR